MKNVYSILTLLILSAVWSCEEKENMDPVGGWELHAPVLSSPAENFAFTLDESLPDTTVRFEWQPAVASNKFTVAYTVVLVPEESEDLTDPILKITPGNGGKELFAAPTAEQIDYALRAACYAPGSTVKLKWAVIGKAIETEATASQNISFTRFASNAIPATLHLTGSATESGEDVAGAIKMRALKDADGNQTNVFDVYTRLTAGATYSFRDQAQAMAIKFGGADGTLAECGPAIAAPETGEYRVTVDLNNNTYQLLKIEKWSLVGDAVEGGWDGDVPLAYKGKGVWESEIELYQPSEEASFIFRANGDWAYVIKRIEGTATEDNNGGKVFMESEASAAGVKIQNIPVTDFGKHIVTLNLAEEGYTYSLVPTDTTARAAIIGETNNPNSDGVAGNFVFGNYDTPSQLFLLSDGVVVAELTKEGETFVSGKYIALEASKKYTLSDKNDGSGTTYNDIGDGTIAVDHDQAYQITVDFKTGKLSWKHYNLKLFHWDEAGGGWGARQELLMTYTHPYTYEVSGTLTSGFHSKFNSPWEVEFGTDNTALTGTMTNGGPNYKGIVQSGNYKATVKVSDDYATAEYTFVKQ